MPKISFSQLLGPVAAREDVRLTAARRDQRMSEGTARQSQSPAAGEHYDTERSQAIVRVILVTLGSAYLVYGMFSGQIPEQARWLIIPLLSGVMIASLALLGAVLRWPGVNHPRRMIGMAHDYAALAIAMTFGGAVLMPLYSLLLWVTIGNGFRYGPRYHLGATVLALVVLGIVIWGNAYWREQTFASLTLLMTTILVPAYAHRLLTRLHRARDEALEANIAKSRFLAQASHDLRQPIHAISLFTACLRDTGLHGEQRQMVNNIDKSLNSVAGLFRSLLDVSTLDSGRVSVKSQVVSLGDLIGEVARQNSEVAQWSKSPLMAMPTAVFVKTDPELLTTIVQNIVSNALKYAPGKPVLIGCRRRGRTISVEIHDRGPGIEAHHLPRLFEEFYQVRAPGDRDVEGVGLGLSIVQRLARLMGLTVTIASRVGHGTRVKIDGLPIAQRPQPIGRHGKASPPNALSELKVLLVEDDEIVLDATAMVLTKWGCVVRRETGIPADDGAQFDLVITDFDLGGKTTGLDCINEMNRRAGRAVPSIIMTGHDPERVRQSIGSTSVSILSKPVHPAELRSTLVAQRFKALRALATANSSDT